MKWAFMGFLFPRLNSEIPGVEEQKEWLVQMGKWEEGVI
jgi:hypothetical protein